MKKKILHIYAGKFQPQLKFLREKKNKLLWQRFNVFFLLSLFIFNLK